MQQQQDIRCGNPDCKNTHGPYLYAYWKQDKKLRKIYVGKTLEDFRLRKIAKQVNLRLSQFIKFKHIQKEASKGNVIAKYKILSLLFITFTAKKFGNLV